MQSTLVEGLLAGCRVGFHARPKSKLARQTKPCRVRVSKVVFYGTVLKLQTGARSFLPSAGS